MGKRVRFCSDGVYTGSDQDATAQTDYGDGVVGLTVFESNGINSILLDDMTPLHYACLEKSFELVRYQLVEKGADVNSRTLKHMETPLHLLCRNSSPHSSEVPHILTLLMKEYRADATLSNICGDNALHLACGSNQMAISRWLLEHDMINIHDTNKYGETPLHRAIAKGNYAMFKMLIEEFGADPYQGFQNALSYAAQCGQYEIANYVVQWTDKDEGVHKIDEILNSIDQSGKTSLHHACEHGHLRIVQLLISRSADTEIVEKKISEDVCLGRTPFDVACAYGHVDVALFLAHEANANVEHRDFYGRTPLIAACSEGSLPMIQTLIESIECDVNATVEYSGATILHMALNSGREDIMRYLASNSSIDKETVDALGSTVLYAACQVGMESMVKSLVLNGANIQVRNLKTGWTPLLAACHAGCVDTARLLIEHGADTASTSNDNDSAMSIACQFQLNEIVLLLIEHKADPNLADSNQRWTALFHACKNDDSDLVRILVENGEADVNFKDSCGKTPLHHMAEIGNCEMVRLLGSYGADVNSTDNDGCTALHYSILGGYRALAKLLLLELKADMDICTKDGRTVVSMGGLHIIGEKVLCELEMLD